MQGLFLSVPVIQEHRQLHTAVELAVVSVRLAWQLFHTEESFQCFIKILLHGTLISHPFYTVESNYCLTIEYLYSNINKILQYCLLHIV